MEPKKCLVILSGGQDSTTCLFIAVKCYGRENVSAITFDYGQRHRIEIDAAVKVAEIAGVSERHEIVRVPDILVSASPLTSNNELEQYEDAEQMEQEIGNRRELTFVPMRNALFLTIAANRAEAQGIRNIMTGVCQMDNANYDDCRQTFIDAAERYINRALGHDHRNRCKGWINLRTPLMNRTKAETCQLAFSLSHIDGELISGGATAWDALAYSHTSYDGKYPPTDMNHANVLRADGFEKANLPDPLVVRAWREGLMGLPGTKNYDTLRNKGAAE